MHVDRRSSACIVSSLNRISMGWDTAGRWIARLTSSLKFMNTRNLRAFLRTRSISFRLYLIIIPTTILAISLFGYLDARFAIGMLDRQVEENTLRVAGQLAEDLARKDFPGDLPGLHKMDR